VKRAIAGLGALILAGATLAPTVAATTTYEGAVKFTYTIPASFTAVINVNYKSGQSSFVTNGTANIYAGSNTGSGTCSAGTADALTSFTLTYGTITPGTGVTACDYSQAIGMSVNTNDANGYKIYESLDLAAAPNYYGLCVIPDGSTTSASATTPAGASAAIGTVGTFTGNVMTACAAGTMLLPTSGTIANAGVGGQVALNQTGVGASSTVVPTTPIFTVAAGAPASGTNYFGEDVQLNIPSTAPSTPLGVTDAIIVYFVSQ